MLRTSILYKGLSVYVNTTTGSIRIGSRGEIFRVTLFYACISRNEARKLRKEFRRVELESLSAESRDGFNYFA